MDDQPGRKRGRPRAEPSLTLCTWLTVQHYDHLQRVAKAQGKSISELAREVLTRALKPPRKIA